MKKISTKRERPGTLRNGSNVLSHHSDESGHETDDIKCATANEREKLTTFIRQNRTNRARSSHVTAGIEPVFSSEPLIAYKYDPGLGRHEDVMLTVKTTLPAPGWWNGAIDVFCGPCWLSTRPCS